MYHTIAGTQAINVDIGGGRNYHEEMEKMDEKIRSCVEKSLPSAKSSIRDFLNDSAKMQTIENEIVADASNRLVIVANNVLMQAVADPVHNSVINAHLDHLNGICTQYRDISISNVQNLMDQLHREKNEAIQSIRADYEFQVKSLKQDLAKLQEVHNSHSNINTRITNLEGDLLFSFSCIFALAIGMGTITFTSKTFISYR